MDFGSAYQATICGATIRRQVWHKDAYFSIEDLHDMSYWHGEGGTTCCDCRSPHECKTKIVMWLYPSDLAANDWEIIPKKENKKLNVISG